MARATFIGVSVETVRVDHESVTIRLGDQVHDDFWMDITIHADELARWYEMIQDRLADETLTVRELAAPEQQVNNGCECSQCMATRAACPGDPGVKEHGKQRESEGVRPRAEVDVGGRDKDRLSDEPPWEAA